jgi:NAD(P)H dehydrogenase (quinone)
LARKDKIAGAFTHSSSFSGDKLNTLIGLVINAMQHGMIYVGTGMLPSANRPEDLQKATGPSPEALNRLGSFTGPMSASFPIPPPEAPLPGDLQTAELYGKRIAEIAERWVRAKG